MQKDISKCYNSFTTSKGNVIWMGTMSLAWKQLAKLHSVDQLHFDNTDPKADQIIRNLNETEFNKDQINEACIYIKAGKGPQTQNTINKDLFEKFPNCSFPPLQFDLKQDSIISFAYLFKKLAFKESFERRKYKQFKFGDKQVQSFYAEEDEQKEQIKVHQYINDNEFCISIADKDNKDVLIFLKAKDDLSVDDAIKRATHADPKSELTVRHQDEFQMPIVEIDASRQYEQMKGVNLKNGKINGPIAVMAEALKLKIDEEGATVESNAFLVQDECAITYPDSRRYHLNKNFWIVMREVGKFPYVCLHIKEPIDA